jgi:PEP-CTERM motif
MKAFVLPFVPPAVSSGPKHKTTQGLGRLTLVLLSGVLLLGVPRAEAGMITWQWAGPVNGYVGCPPGAECGARFDEVVPLGTNVNVFVSLDPLVPTNPNFSTSCFWGTADTSFEVLGRTYSGLGHVWVDAAGFGPGVCAPSSNRVEVVVPGWGSGGPALPGGWVPFFNELPGLWWSGDLTNVQPTSISSQFPLFAIPFEAARQGFTVNLQAVPAELTPVPEPATLTLFGAGLAAAWAARRRRRD